MLKTGKTALNLPPTSNEALVYNEGKKHIGTEQILENLLYNPRLKPWVRTKKFDGFSNKKISESPNIL